MSSDLFATNYVTDIGEQIWVDEQGHEWVYDPVFHAYIEVEVQDCVKSKIMENVNWAKEGF